MEFSTESMPHEKYQAPNDGATPSFVPRSNAAIVAEKDGLDAIRRKSVNLAVWERDQKPELAPVLSWLVKDPFEMEFSIDPEDVSKTLDAELPSEEKHATIRASLISDIQDMAGIFTKYTGAAKIRLMVEALHRVPCPKFHQDNVVLRLVSTYTGKGSEWLENSNINLHPDCCGGSIVLDETRIQTLKPFSIALMKGKLWPGNDIGLYHRSPLSHTQEPRLVIKMDIAS